MIDLFIFNMFLYYLIKGVFHDFYVALIYILETINVSIILNNPKFQHVTNLARFMLAI